MSTTDNLKAAFAGESQANRKYLAFAKKAEAEGFAQVGKMFRAAAEAETIHAHAHLRALGEIKSTAENLQAAADGEGYEFKSMYPPMVAEAQAEKNQAALTSFQFAMAAEKVHYELYNKALEAVKAGKDTPACRIYICSVCGNVEIDAAPDQCRICGAAKSRFVEAQ
jgi:rubrerythrin